MTDEPQRMQPTSFVRRWQALIAAVILSLVLGGVGLAQGVPLQKTLFAYSLVIGFGFVVGLFQTRSEILAVFAGNPTDERQQLIHTRALAMAAEIGVIVAIAGYVLSEAAGRDSLGFAVAAATLGFGYVVGVVWLRSRV